MWARAPSSAASATVAGLIGAVIASRLEPLQQAVREAQDTGGPSARQQVRDLLDAALRFKTENRQLMSAAEDAGLSSPYQAEHYDWWHRNICAALVQVPGVRDAEFTAHALLAVIRADLVAHLIDDQKMAPERLRASLAAYLDNVLGDIPDPSGTSNEAPNPDGPSAGSRRTAATGARR